MKQQRIIYGHGATLPLFVDGVCLHILDISLSINSIIWREISVSNQLEYASWRTWFYATFLPYFPFPTQFATFKFQDLKLSYVSANNNIHRIHKISIKRVGTFQEEMIKHSRETFKLSFVYTTTLFTESTKVSITRVKHFRKKWSSLDRKHWNSHLCTQHNNKLYPQSLNHRSYTFQKEMIKCKEEETFRQTLDPLSTTNIHRIHKVSIAREFTSLVFSGEISLFFNKEIGNIFDNFCFFFLV